MATDPNPALHLQFDNVGLRALPADSVTDNRRRQVHHACYSSVTPTPVSAPYLVACSQELVQLLGLTKRDVESKAFAQVFSGNTLLPGMEPTAACYGGHQFGSWAGQLGDGRAISLGEAIASDGQRWELQLKGAGPTPYSRMGDGRAVMRSSVREFLCSEAMHHLGIPTTRALSLVATGDLIERDILYTGNPQLEPGAIVCRMAHTFLRFGNYELPAIRGEIDTLRVLTDYTLAQFYPHLQGRADAYAALFSEVCQRSARLVADWQRVGFVHGVLNTDNMSITGLTIDYGPYGWLDDYNPDWTPNTTDAVGRRYRFGWQPLIVGWNLARLGESLLPLIGDDAVVEAALRDYQQTFARLHRQHRLHKLGLTGDSAAIVSEVEVDALLDQRDASFDPAARHALAVAIRERLEAEGGSLGRYVSAILDHYIGYFAQGGTGLPDPAYYTREDEDARALLGLYNGYVQQILALTGTAGAYLAAEAQLVIDLETRIARASRPVASLRDPRQNYALVPTDGLGKSWKRLQLPEFLAAQGVSDDSVSVANPELFTTLDGLVGSLKPAQWKTYLRFHVGNAMAPYLSKSFRDAAFDFRGRVLRGEAGQPAREHLVLDAINHAAGQMVAREYVARYLPPANRSRAEAIAAEVRDALRRAVARAPWLDDATRAEAEAKLAALKIEVGAPVRDVDYSVQPMGRGSFGGNMLIASTWHHREEMKRIGRGNAQRRWPVQAQDPALAYDPAHNRLLVSAAVLQPPVLDMSLDGAAHYGAFGALVAHELSHAIDGKGRHVDARGEVRDWWTPGTAAAWTDRLNALAAQYGNYDHPGLDGRKVNGSLTREENAADLAAAEIAWDAFSEALPGADLDARKSFFSAWAGLWREQVAPAVAEQRAGTAQQAPGQWRSNGPLSNLPAFGETWGCKAGDPMVRGDDVRIGIWR